jgi:hypothetical protein
MSIEAGVVIDDDGEALYWHLPHGRSAGGLPDSSDLWWKVFWAQRDRITGFAHSHPGNGLPGPSHEDITTFAAVEQGLGKRLEWYICSADRLVIARWSGPRRYEYNVNEDFGLLRHPWLPRLRELSDYQAGAGSSISLPEGA